jgi:hypothetical protein
MPNLFTEQEMTFLRRPNIARVWLVELTLLDGEFWRLHSGAGKVTISGHEWSGVTDPGGQQLVQISPVEDPRFGQAAKIDIVLSGVTRDFVKSVKERALEIEGLPATVYWVAVDQETLEVWSSGPKQLFPGYLSAPKVIRNSISSRTVSLAIESLWQSQNYQWGGFWNFADQQRRFPGDKGLQFVGVDVYEIIKP